jgi:hypothetical protein
LRASQHRPPRWPLAGLVALLLPVLPAPTRAEATPAPAPEPEAPEPEAKPAEPDGDTRVLLIRADRQSYDRLSGTLTVSGNVEARLEGWRLLADRIELREGRRSVFASGRIRLFKGDQRLQAASLRYNAWEGSGTLTDVYGVVDQESLSRELKALRPDAQSQPDPAADPAPTAIGETAIDDSFACPELSVEAGSRSVLQLLPPRRGPLPTMPAPPGCPGGDAGRRDRRLSQILNDVAMEGPSSREAPSGAPVDGADGASGASDAAAPPQPVRQRVSDVRFRQSVDTTVKVDLAPLIQVDNPAPGGTGSYRPAPPRQGQLNRLRFQASSISIRRNSWFAEAVAFTNDPFTPAKAWTYARGVEAEIRPGGVTSIRARESRILLGERLAVPTIRDAQIGQQQAAISIDSDRRDRDGVFLGYNLPPLRLGSQGSLRLQPQLMIQRAIEGRTGSYVRPGTNLVGPDVEQDAKFGDFFGLAALLDVPVGRFRLYGDASLSTFNPDNFRAGTRSNVQFGTPLELPGHSSSRALVFGSYRERVFNGSLGQQTVVYSYGAEAEGTVLLNTPKNTLSNAATNTPPSTPYFTPVSLNWQVLSGNYQAALFETDTLDTQWRSLVRGGISSSLRLWEARDGGDSDPLVQLRYAPEPVIPGLGLDVGIRGSSAFYQDGASQNTVTLAAGPSFTIGRFEKPFFDYTRFSASVAGTYLDGASPFSFDRTVDLRTVSFNASQQIYGPLVLEAGATFNIDNDSPFFGDVSYSYVELKLQQRAYELGIFYSPYDGIGGIRIRLNDFDFNGGGTPFVPRPEHRGG